MARTQTNRGIYGLAFLILRLISNTWAHSPGPENIDTTLANQILSYVNKNISACDDYFQYACGKWSEKHESDSFNEITGLIDHKVNKAMVNYLDELEKQSLEPNSVEGKALRVYQNCRQSTNATRSGRHYLQLVPPNDHIPWPQFTQKPAVWASNKFQWMETMARLRRYGMDNVFFQLTAWPDLLNSSRYIISIKNPTLDQKTPRLESAQFVKLRLLLLGVDARRVRSMTRKIKTLEAAVVELVDEHESEESSDDLSLRQLEAKTHGKWRKYLQILRNRRIPAHTTVEADNEEYLKALIHLLDNYDREVLATYIMLRFVMHMQEESMDSDEPIPCAQEVRRNMELAANLFYERRYIGSTKLKQLQEDVSQLFEQLRRQFFVKLDGNNLHLKRSQREMLREKMNAMRLNIGNMPQSTNLSQFVDQYYKDLQLTEDQDYARIQLQLLEFRTIRWFEQLEMPAANRSSFFYISDSDTAMGSTPYYMLRQNLIIIPYSILQEPVFHHDSHDIYKISLLGFMLSHELMHGFVSGSLYFDSQGNVNDVGVDIIQQNRYVAALNCLNRDETDYIDEREADIAGIRLAYDVYFGPASNFNQTQPEFTTVPLKQFFFLNMAQFFCGDLQPIFFVDHDADDTRLKQVLINFPAFAQAYNCRQDLDNMHPSEKCRLW